MSVKRTEAGRQANRGLTTTVLVSALSCCAGVASAQSAEVETTGAEPNEPRPPGVGVRGEVIPTDVLLLDDGAYWRYATPRWFVSGKLSLGYIYLRSTFAMGYGRPYHEWVGLEASPLVQGSGVGAFAGGRMATPHLDVRLGARYQFTFTRSLLEPEESYNVPELESRSGPPSRYLAFEARIEGKVPIGPHQLVLGFRGVSLHLVDDGFFVYEERDKIVVDPPWLWIGKVGYAVPFFDEDRGELVVMVEVLGNPGRDAVVIRAGFEATFRLFRDFDAQARWVPPLVGPDRIGADGGHAFELGVRYRWASGSPQ